MHFFDNLNKNLLLPTVQTSQSEFKSHCRKLTFQLDDEESPLVQTQTQPNLNKYVFSALIDPLDIIENESIKVQSQLNASLLYKKQLAQRINSRGIIKKANPIRKIDFDLMDPLTSKKVCLEPKHMDFECLSSIMNPEEEDFQIPEAFERFEDDYEVLSILGKGHSGKVMKCLNRKSNQVEAIKCCEIVGQEAGRQRINQQEGYNEIFCLIQLNKQRSCNNIIHYIDSWRDKRKLYVAIEVCDYSVKGIDMDSEYIKEDIIKKILKDITNGLIVFHKNKLVHLDIKPENLLFHKKSDSFKIADLGLTRSSQLLLSDDLREGDARYFAPELLLNHSQVHDLTSADIFSLGISIFEMMIRDISKPNKELPKNGPFWKYLRSGLSDSDFGVNRENYSQPLKQIIIQMMAQDHNKRPSAEALSQYPYLSDL